MCCRSPPTGKLLGRIRYGRLDVKQHERHKGKRLRREAMPLPDERLRTGTTRRSNPASHTTSQRDVKVRQTSHERSVPATLASDQHSVISPRQEAVTETNIIGGELIQGDVVYQDDIVFEGKGARSGCWLLRRHRLFSVYFAALSSNLFGQL